jgi:hypothetical protein
MLKTIFYHNKTLIRKLSEGYVFVFGSNDKGLHGKGSARDAHLYFGAKYGQAFGLQGRAFAIPTRMYLERKEKCFKDIPLKQIKQNVDLFYKEATMNPSKCFVITRIGCGNAGYSDEQIAPMFSERLSNMILPQEWLPYIEHDQAILVSL